MAMTPMEEAPLLPWTEIGRAAPENEPWAAWIAQEHPDLTLYRCLILVDGTALVTIDVHRRGSAQTLRLHNGQCPVPRDRPAAPESLAGLLALADRAARHALAGGPGSSRAA